MSIKDKSYDLTTGLSIDTSSLLVPETITIGNIDLSAYTTRSSLNLGAYSTSSYNITRETQSVKIGQSGLDLDANCDIKIGNTSLKTFMNIVEQRLAILTPNPNLEKEWNELKQLGDQYRALEKHINEKMTTWNILNQKTDDDFDQTI
jgi:hypothetical protein